MPRQRRERRHSDGKKYVSFRAGHAAPFHATEAGRRVAGSGANAPRTGDDGQMPRFLPVEELFKGRHFDREIVILCVRWYLSYKLSYRDLVAMMNERGIHLVHTTIFRWVQHYSPEFEKRTSNRSGSSSPGAGPGGGIRLRLPCFQDTTPLRYRAYLYLLQESQHFDKLNADVGGRA
jgi:hypothetical protein